MKQIEGVRLVGVVKVGGLPPRVLKKAEADGEQSELLSGFLGFDSEGRCWRMVLGHTIHTLPPRGPDELPRIRSRFTTVVPLRWQLDYSLPFVDPEGAAP